jgi:hypothetical protein
MPLKNTRNVEVLPAIIAGLRLENPVEGGAPLKLWAIIEKCWAQQPEFRPSFAQLVERFGSFAKALAGPPARDLGALVSA